jgi:DNA-binding LacI/PurR family transcriptional regulator
MASFVNPPLTTVLQDTRRAGEMLVDSLLRLIHDEHVESRMLPMKLMVRRSSLWQDVARSESTRED